MNKVAEKIAGEIRARGAIPFARFMELALYCPVYGFYEKEGDIIGRGGDFFTSVSVGSLFGELLAFQFAEWLDAWGEHPGESKVRSPSSKLRHANDLPGQLGGPFQLVEAGAHRGELARDILNWLQQNRSHIYNCVEYWILEPSERRQEWQRQALAQHAGKVRWLASLERPVRGIIFSNELLDAMPVHRLGWDAAAQRWFEFGVTLSRDGFIWTRMAASPEGNDEWPRPMFPEALQAALPDGFVIETCPTAADWWWQAAESLEFGKLLTIDYGFAAGEGVRPERTGGTLRSYRRHRSDGDVLAVPGEQDITAHVDFAQLQALGERAGLITESFVTQEQFLTRIAAQGWREGGRDWTREHTRQFQTLTHPQHLGRVFRVLIQARQSAIAP